MDVAWTRDSLDCAQGARLGGAGVSSAQVTLVGDSKGEVQTARNAGTWICCATHGFGSHRFDEFPPDILVDNLMEFQPHLSDVPAHESRGISPESVAFANKNRVLVTSCAILR